MEQTVTQIRQRLEQEKGRLAQVKGELERNRRIMARLHDFGVVVERAQVVFQEAAQLTQSRLSFYIDGTVSMAVDAVFPGSEYQFSTKFVQRRGTTEADIRLTDGHGNEISPRDADGGGLINVVSFALRIALWSLAKRSRPVFLLDEPFHFLHSRDAHARVAELLTHVADELAVQIIMITGEDESEEIVSGADRVFRIDGGVLV